MTYQPSGSPNLYLSGLASGISGYNQLAKPPMAAAAEVDLTQTCITGGGEVLMQSWVSTALGLLQIAAGTWSFNVYGFVDVVDGVSEIVIRVSKRIVTGTETELFTLTTGSLTAAAAGYILTSSQGDLSLAAVTDRLVVKIYAKTTSATSRTVHLYYLGAARQTRMALPVELPVVPGGDMLASLYDTDGDGQIGSTGGHIIQDEGTDLASQARMNFKGAGVTASNNTGTGATDVDIPGASADPWIGSSDTWSYSSEDSPTFVISANADMTGKIGPGYRIKLTQTTVKYFIVTAVGSYTGGATLITVYGGTDYTLANAAISSPCYSPAKAPLGFPMSPDKWTVAASDTTQYVQVNPTQNAWYNAFSISLPIGMWRVFYESLPSAYKNGAITMQVTLSTANNSESDTGFTSAGIGYSNMSAWLHLEKILTLAAKTTYYLNYRTIDASVNNIYMRGDRAASVIRAVCGYL